MAVVMAMLLEHAEVRVLLLRVVMRFLPLGQDAGGQDEVRKE